MNWLEVVITGIGTVILPILGWVIYKTNGQAKLEVRVDQHEKLLDKISSALDKNVEALTKLGQKFEDHFDNDKAAFADIKEMLKH